jgi:hypothetical protein
MEVLFARYCANDGGPFRQVLRWERSLPCRFIWFNEGEYFWFPALDFRTSTIGWGRRMPAASRDNVLVATIAWIIVRLVQ